MENMLDKLKKALMGQQAPIDVPMAPELQESQEAAQTAQVNEQAKSPNMMTKPELVQKEVAQEADKTVQGQMQERNLASEVETPVQNLAAGAKEESSLEKLIRQRNEIETQRDMDLKKAKESDSRSNMIRNALGALGTIAQADIQRNAKTDLGIKAFKGASKTDTTSDVHSSKDRLLKRLKEDYDLMQAAQKGGMTAYQKAQIEGADKDRALKEKLAKTKGSSTKKGLTKVEEERQKDLAERFTSLEAAVPNTMANIEEANFLMNELESGNVSTGPGSKLAGTIGSFFDTDESALKERLDSLAEKAARAQLKANGETRPTDADVEGMKRAMFNLGNTETTNVEKLRQFIKQQESGLDEYRQMKEKVDSGEGIENFKLKPTYKNDVQEVKRRTKDGRTAIFNADTKEFLRYE